MIPVCTGTGMVRVPVFLTTAGTKQGLVFYLLLFCTYMTFFFVFAVMYHIVKGSSFDLLLSAAAANGTLSALVSKLLLFNEGCKVSTCLPCSVADPVDFLSGYDFLKRLVLALNLIFFY
jgi:hypothetical protein